MSGTKTRPPHQPAPAARGHRRPGAGRRFPVLLLGGAAFAALLIIALVVSAISDDPTEVGEGIDQVRAVQVTGTALPDHDPSGADPAVGMAAPVLNGSDFAGEPVTIGSPGEAQLIFFLAHWCSHCRAEVPVVAEWLDEQGAPEGVRLAAVSTSVSEDRPNYPPSEWLANEDWTVATLADDSDSSSGRAYGLTGFPYFVALDADGQVVARASGELSIEQIEGLISAAREGVAGPVVQR